MKSRTFDLKTMTVDDLFRAKQERRQRLASLPFEEKIEIVKRLQEVSRAARAQWDQDRRQAAIISARLASPAETKKYESGIE